MARHPTAHLTCLILFGVLLPVFLTMQAGAQSLRLIWGIDTPTPPMNQSVRVTDLAADDSNNSYVVGYEGVAPDFRYLTIKYRDDRTPAWTQRYRGEDGSESRGSAIAVDDEGNVYVTGYSYGDSTYVDYATVKYSPAGEELWVARYSSPGRSTDIPNAIGLDGRGNVYVTGESHSGGTYDFATVKYSSSGEELWVARYDGLAHLNDRAFRLGFDAAGSVYVLGSSEEWNGRDILLVKYDTSGQELWAIRYDGQDHLNDDPGGLAVSGDGTSYVTGKSDNNGFTWSYCVTLKVSPAGGVDWAKMVTPHQANAGVSVAIDTSGVVFVTVSSWAARSYFADVYCFGEDGTLSWSGSAGNTPGEIAAAPWGGAYYAADPASVGAVAAEGSRERVNAGSGTPVGIALGGRGNVFFLSTARMDRFVDDLFQGVDDPDHGIPEEFVLKQNYPNPFNPSTTIRYALPVRSYITLSIFNTLGQLVATIVEGEMDPGYHEVVFNASGLASGMYLYRLQVRPLYSAIGLDSKSGAVGFVQSRKMLVVR
jgi:hypothetical protein